MNTFLSVFRSNQNKNWSAVVFIANCRGAKSTNCRLFKVQRLANSHMINCVVFMISAERRHHRTSLCDCVFCAEGCVSESNLMLCQRDIFL